MSGHHPVYLEKIAEGLLKAGHHVTIAIAAQDAEHPCMSSLRQRYTDSISVYLINTTRLTRALSSRLGDPGREISMRRLYAEAYRQVDNGHKVEHVLLPYLDYCLHAIALLGTPFGSTPWSGICMRPSFHHSRMGLVAPIPRFSRIKELLFRRLFSTRGISAVISIDELLVKYSIERLNICRSKICYMGDPAELKGMHTRESARIALKIPQEQRVILVFGSIDERKGLPELIRNIKNHDDCADIAINIIGKQNRWAINFLSSPECQFLFNSNRIYQIDDFVDEEIQQMAFAAADVVWLGYHNHYTMSGVLVLSALANRPVIGTDCGLIGHYISAWKIGATHSVGDLESISKSWPSHIDEESNFQSVDYSWSSALSTIKRTLQQGEMSE